MPNNVRLVDLPAISKNDCKPRVSLFLLYIPASVLVPAFHILLNNCLTSTLSLEILFLLVSLSSPVCTGLVSLKLLFSLPVLSLCWFLCNCCPDLASYFAFSNFTFPGGGPSKGKELPERSGRILCGEVGLRRSNVKDCPFHQ